MAVKLKELIEQLQEYAQMGYADAKVYVRCEGFELVDLDADGELRSFDAVHCTGVEEAGHGTGMPAHVILGREEPKDAMKRMRESGWWADLAECLPAGNGSSDEG